MSAGFSQTGSEATENTVLVGSGRASRLKHAPEDLGDNPITSIIYTDDASYVSFSNLWFHGEIESHSFSGNPGNANSELIDPAGGSYVRIENCFFDEPFRGECIDLDRTSSSFNYSIKNNFCDMRTDYQSGEGILIRGHGHQIHGNYVVGSKSPADHRAAIAVDDGSTYCSIVGNVVEDSNRAYDIRGDPSDPKHLFFGNIARGEFEAESNLDGVADGMNHLAE